MTKTVITDKHKSMISELREKIKDVVSAENLLDDQYFFRFLKARNFDIGQAEKFIRENIEWRKRNKCDKIVEEYVVPELRKYISFGLLGATKNGSVLALIRLGKTDLKGLLSSIKYEAVLEFWIWVMEMVQKAMREESKKKGITIDTVTTIFDCEELSMKQVASTEVIKFLRDAIYIFEMYPESLEASYIVNSMKMFQICFSLVSPFMQQNTIDKIKFFTPKDNWKEVLLQHIDAEVLPVHWGGTRVDSNGDPTCTELVPNNGEVPKEYYTVPAGKLLAELKDVGTITVDGGSTAMVEADLTTPGCFLKWIFGTKEHDIAFGVYRKTASGLEEHCPVERINCAQFAAEGELECRETGTYTMVFDNSYSKIRSKTILFRVEVLPPNEKAEKKRLR